MTFTQNFHLIHLVCEDVKIFGRMQGSCPVRYLRRIGGFVLPAAVLFSLILGGCSGPTLPQIQDQKDFDRLIMHSKEPVLVDFYKDGCPTCVVLEPKLVKLAEEYKGRVTFASFKLMEAYFVVKAPELKERYNVSYFPTVILIVDGQEKERWVLKYDIDQYREVLDKIVGPGKNQSAIP